MTEAVAIDDPTRCCANCRFWRTWDNQVPPSAYGTQYCHRRSPKAFRQPGGTPHTRWPDTRFDAWCGEHEVRP